MIASGVCMCPGVRCRLAVDDVRHGRGGYTNHGCRCALCRQKNREYVLKAREKWVAGTAPPHVHGTANGYRNYSCRCDECRHAVSKSRRSASA